MQIVAYLNFDGTCAEAFKFYEEVLRGKIAMIGTYADMPGDHVTEETKDRIIHVRLEVGDAVLMGSDCPPGRFEAQQGIWVSLQTDSTEESERIFEALEEGGAVRMPLGETPWAHRFGMVVDRFGTPWMINCQKMG